MIYDWFLNINSIYQLNCKLLSAAQKKFKLSKNQYYETKNSDIKDF